MRIVIILLVLAINTSVAQDKSDFKRQLILKITPTSVFDPHGSRLPVGVGFHFALRWSASLEYSIPLKVFSGITNGGSGMQINKDRRLRSDLKYFTSSRLRGYIGLEGFYRNQHLTSSPGYWTEEVPPGHSQTYSYSFANVEKTSYGVGIIIGGKVKVAGRVSFEPYIGAGVRHVSIHRSNIQNLSVSLPSKDYTNYLDIFGLFPDEVHAKGEFTGVYIPCGIKLNIVLADISP
jgi:hypothetical protein